MVPLHFAPIALLAIAQPSVLFVRGADRSGGFLEAQNDAQRTEHLADINNTSTSSGNHGWYELAQALAAEGFLVSQAIEPLEPGAPTTGQTQGAHIDLELLDLSGYDMIVMGSNNAVYDTPAIDAIEQFVLQGGGVLFISDAGFGSNWADASNSDQQFLDRFGWVIQQDLGLYALERSLGDFLVPQHPVLLGVDAIDGEGVSPGVWTGTDVGTVTTTPLVRTMPGAQTRNNDAIPGSVRPTTPSDFASVVAQAGCGRIAIHFDRNTFFNANGAGTDLSKFDNQLYAMNLFYWLSDAGVDTNDNGVLEFDDVIDFLVAFLTDDPAADLAAPFGVYDITDILDFLYAYQNNCL